MKIYPAIDLMGGKVVRLSQGRFESQKVYADDPLLLARDFQESGASYLHIVDLDGARLGSPQQTALIERLAAASGLKLQVGGGVRKLGDVERLLAAGVERVVIGSLAVKDPALTLSIFREFSGARLTLGLDLCLDEKGVARVATEGWQSVSEIKALDLIARFREAGLEQVLCTDISRDGMLAGPHQELYQTLKQQEPELIWLASGGISSLKDLRELRTIGLGGAIIGKALYEGRFTLKEALTC